MTIPDAGRPGLTDPLRRARAHTPTYVLANALTSVVDLIPPRLMNGGPVEIVGGVQMNGPPHLGTALTLLLAVALAARARTTGAFQPSILLEVLDNAPGGDVRRDAQGAPFRMLLSDLASLSQLNGRFAENYGWLLETAAAQAVPLKLRWHSKYQASRSFRETLLRTLGNAAELGAQLSPRSGRLPIRFPCPRCGLVDVHSRYVELRNTTSESAEFSARCIEHGAFDVCVAPDGEGSVDVNSLYRNVIRDLDRIASAEPPAISIKGLDWIHGAHVVDRALALFEAPEEQRPVRLFTPVVADANGAKLSKSHGLQSRHLLAADGPARGRADALYGVAAAFIDQPPLFFRGYTADALLELMGEAGAVH